jgi:nicotinamide-nucleotide amidase
MSTRDEVPGQLPEGQVLGATLHAELTRRGMTLATAESITGGALADLVSASPCASEAYLGGIVSHTTQVKTGVLGVDAAVVAEHGVVSAACALEMAVRVRSMVGADWGLSTTGVAGPTEQEGKPVGTVFVGIAGPDAAWTHDLHLSGDRSEIRATTCRTAAHELLAAVTREGT